MMKKPSERTLVPDTTHTAGFDETQGHHDLMDAVLQDPLLTIQEVADQLRVDETTVRRWITSGVLEAIALPHVGPRQVYRIRQSTLDALLSPDGPRRS